MIGRMIDRAAATLLGTAGLYVLFLNAGLGIGLSLCMTAACMALARQLWMRRPRRRRVTRAQAEAALLSIALAGDEAALRTLSGRADAAVLIRHPGAALGLGELFEIWRERGDGAAIVLPCDVDEAAAAFADSRGMALIGKKALVKRIRQTGLYVADDGPGETLSAKLAGGWSNLRVRPRMIAYSLSLLAAYLATGRAVCLACALGVLGIAGAKLIEGHV